LVNTLQLREARSITKNTLPNQTGSFLFIFLPPAVKECRVLLTFLQ
jgi:hypothetical protein